MFTVVLPSSVAPATQYAGQGPQLAPGQIVEAVVLALLKDGAARIAIADLVLDVRAEIPLQVGSTLRLAVKGTEQAIKLVPISGSVRPPVAGPPGVTGNEGVTPQRIAASPPNNAPEPIVKVDVTNPTAMHAAVGLASPGGAVRAEQGEASPAVRISGAPSTSHSPGQPAPPADAAAATPQTALNAAVRAGAARQNGLAPLIANLRASIAHPAFSPAPVQEAAAVLLRLGIAADRPAQAADIRAALMRSGLLFEAQAGRDGSAPTPDIKLALLALRQALRAWLAEETPTPTMAKQTGEGARPAPPPIPEAPPPYRGAPTAAQPAASPTIADLEPHDVAARLLTQTEGALARQTLLQAASLPERTEAHSDASGSRWLFESPLVSPAGTSVAQFEISREGGRGPSAGEQIPVWRARFSVDIEPIGPVHAQISLIGARAAVMLWAERDATAGLLRERTASLAEALRQAELDPDIHFRAGAPSLPSSARPAAGHFLDRAS